MGALGALFAFLTAFVITIEWGQRRDTEKTIGLEADACVRLAWASESPGCDGVAIRSDLEAYLHSCSTRSGRCSPKAAIAARRPATR